MTNVCNIISLADDHERQFPSDEEYVIDFYPPHAIILCGKQIKIYTKQLFVKKNERKPVLDVETKTPVVAALGLTNGQFYLVEENGRVQSWSFLMGAWSFSGEIDLCDPGSKVKLALIHEDQRVMYWCEESENSLKMCKKALPSEKADLSNSTVGSKMELLTNLPLCDLYVLETAVLIWPRQPSPPGLFMKWFQQQNKLEVHVLGKGCIFSQEILLFGKAVNFSDMCMQVVAGWSQNNCCTDIYGKVWDSKHRQVYIITSDSKTVSVNHQQGQSLVCQLACVPQHGRQWCVFNSWLIEIGEDVHRFYDLKSGALCQEVDVSPYGPCSRPWSHCGLIQTAGFTTTSGIYQYQNSPGDLNFQQLLEKTHNYLKDLPDPTSLLEQLNMANVSHTPSLLLPLIHRCKELNMTPGFVGQEETFHEMHNDFSKHYQSGLNLLLSSHLMNYWDIQQTINSLLNDPETLPLIARQTVRDEMMQEILQPSNPIDSNSRRARLELLAKDFPSEVLECLLDHLEFGAENMTPSLIEKWQSVLQSEGGDGHSTFPLFEILVRLLYTQQPGILVKFIALAQQLSERTREGSAFSRNKLVEVALYERALACLPSPEKSVDVENAVLCKAQLMLKQGEFNSSTKALQLLQDYGLWDAGLGLLKHLFKTTNLQHELFHVLISTSLKNGVFGCYGNDIMNLMPESFSLPVLLELMEDNLPNRGTEIFVDADDKRAVPFECLRPYVNAFVNGDSSSQDKE